jgi:plastocyanin
MRGAAIILGAALVLAGLTAGARPALASETGTVTGRVAVSRNGAAATAGAAVVVYLVGFAEPPPARQERILQKDRAFVPDLLPITAGQSVEFPNRDPHLHNVFSPSPTRPFDLGQFERGESKSRRFPSPGVVDVYCNIHPEMSATILVLPNRQFTRTDRQGRFRLTGVPPGRWTLYAYSRRAERPVSAPVTVAGGETSQVELSLVETRGDSAHRNKYGERYRDPRRYR